MFVVNQWCATFPASCLDCAQCFIHFYIYSVLRYNYTLLHVVHKFTSIVFFISCFCQFNVICKYVNTFLLCAFICDINSFVIILHIRCRHGFLSLNRLCLITWIWILLLKIQTHKNRIRIDYSWVDYSSLGVHLFSKPWERTSRFIRVS